MHRLVDAFEHAESHRAAAARRFGREHCELVARQQGNGRSRIGFVDTDGLDLFGIPMIRSWFLVLYGSSQVLQDLMLFRD